MQDTAKHSGLGWLKSEGISIKIPGFCTVDLRKRPLLVARNFSRCLWAFQMQKCFSQREYWIFPRGNAVTGVLEELKRLGEIWILGQYQTSVGVSSGDCFRALPCLDPRAGR